MKMSLTNRLAAPSQPVIRNAILLVIMFVVFYVVGMFHLGNLDGLVILGIILLLWGLIIALPLMWFSCGDEDLLMAAGSFATPHLFPYHFNVLMPALARMRIPKMLVTWLVSWTLLLSNRLGSWARHFGNLMSVCFWAGIYFNRQDSARLERAAARRAETGNAA